MADSSSDLRLITFRLLGGTFVLDIMAVRQILPYSGSDRVPTAPPFVEGIVVVRDEVIPIVDLRRRLYGDRDSAAEPRILVVDTAAGAIGFKVDEVRRIIRVPPDALLPPPPIIGGIRGEMLIGIVRRGEEVYLLLDVDQILTQQEKGELETADLRPHSDAAAT